MFELVIRNDEPKDNKENKDSKEKKKVKTKEENKEKPKDSAHVQQINILKNTLESLAPLVDELNINFHQNGIQIQTMDARNVCYCEFHISSELFSSYRCDRELVIGIKLKTLLTSLRNLRLDDFQSYTLSCNDDNKDNDKLKVDVIMESADVSYEIQLFKYESENYELPPITFVSESKIPISKFLMASKSLNGEYADISVNKDSIVFASEGEDLNSKFNLKGKDIKISCDEAVERTVAMKYINAMSKAASLAENVEFLVGKSATVVFTFNLEGRGYLSYFIAPNDEEESEEENEIVANQAVESSED